MMKQFANDSKRSALLGWAGVWFFLLNCVGVWHGVPSGTWAQNEKVVAPKNQKTKNEKTPVPPTLSDEAEAKPKRPAENPPPTDTVESKPGILLIQGAGGTQAYQEIFTTCCQNISDAATKADIELVWLGKPQKGKEQSSIKDQIQKEISTRRSGGQLWLILIGHGTFDRQAAKFNLEGPDLTAKELNEWLEPVTQPVAIVNCASSSAPFINRLSKKNRVIVTATQSGFELNYTRFGIHFSSALTDLKADIDKDDQVSILEAFLYAARRVEEFYKSDSRLATEHALIDDNGDGKGTPLNFFRGVRVVKKSGDKQSIPDGAIANQIHLLKSEFELRLSENDRKERNRLEIRLERLRLQRDSMSEAEYLKSLEEVLVSLAQLYQKLEDQELGDQEQKLEDRKLESKKKP